MERAKLYDGWEVRPKANRFAEKIGAGAEWEPVVLPHDAVIGLERTASATSATGFFPGGIWEYRRTLTVEEEDLGSVVVLEFEGVHRDAVVSVNGVVCATRPYGYSCFLVQIDHLLRIGDNEVMVQARSHEDSRWYTGAGLYRDVWLMRSGRVHVGPEGLVVTTPEIDDDLAVVSVAVPIHNESIATSTATLSVEIVDRDGTIVAESSTPITTFPGDRATARLRLDVPRPRRWSVDQPDLYQCRAILSEDDRASDRDETTFGIRSLSLDARRGLRINDEPVLLRGACVHHDNGPIGAATVPRAEERRVELLKAAGFNALRSAHQPMSRAMLDACDRIGMIVMDESFDVWSRSKTDDDYASRFDDWWEADIEAMVRNARNHPCVVFYSIGNEIPDGDSPAGVRQGRALAERVRELDPTRYVTQGISGLLVTPGLTMEYVEQMMTPSGDEAGINTAITNLGDLFDQAVQSERVDAQTAEAFAVLDVAGYNYMSSRFAADGTRHPHRVIVSTESHPPKIARDWAAVVDNPHVIGDFTWTGWDYLGESGVGRLEYEEEAPEFPMRGFLAEYPWLTAWCADIDITGRRRPQSYLLGVVYGLRRDPYIAVVRPEHHGRHLAHTSPWSFDDVVPTWSWPGRDGEPMTVQVYAAADEVELLCNGRSVGTAAVASCRVEFETAYEPGRLEAVARRDGVEVARSALQSASGAVSLHGSVDRPEVRADPSDLAYVDLTLVDDDGIRWFTEDRPIEVTVDGPAILQGLASADPRSLEPFIGTTCTTFDGHALAVVRPTGSGTIEITAIAEGCPPVHLRTEAS